MEDTAKIVAVITTKKDNIYGGAPIFVTKDRDGLQQVSSSLEKIMDASAHEIDEDTMIIVAR